ncbi:hypothetical protein C8A00DRAFT_37256 [Chaetomidium leptoderma]|uniref:Homeobox domain-containing protein n=1 Tax=Chaetomidium leptoderma TaxID=669021 RepID=A0AAN6ZSF1_9PEZI|nr:hypothetical protein C8A00DRAFT_37256 [Chaetomidium leptoderma]
MDLDYMDPFRRHYPSLNMQSYAGQQHQAHPQGAQYPYWNPMMAYYQQQHRAAALMGQQGNMHLSKPAEPKPRLAKDEVELLEQEFAKNQKPSSSTKRELADQMGVEVPRINNWFQNRRAKEKQMKKTAEFEAQQARERAASEADSTSDQDQPRALSSTAVLGGDEEEEDDDDDDDAVESDYVAPKSEPIDEAALTCVPRATCASPASSDSDGFVHVKYEPSAHPIHGMANLTAPGPMVGSFGETHCQNGYQQQHTAFPFRLADPAGADDLIRPGFESLNPHHGGVGMSGDVGAFSPFTDQDYFATPSVSRFPSEMVAANAPLNVDIQLLRHQISMESLAHSDAVSPCSMPGSPSAIPDLRLRSPPPPADIAGRRKSRRPAPLGLSSLRGGPGPKTGFEVPRRADTVSPMRRISSATGSLCGRVQKTFMGPGGPRSPFAMDRNKEALLQTLQETQPPNMTSLNSAMSPMSPEGMLAVGMGDCATGAHASDDEQGYPFGALGAVNGLHLYSNNNNAESTIKSPPGTPGLQMGFHEAYFPSSLDHAWNYAPQDEPLPTPSLCSHGGSELEFSMAPQLPGYVASQPVTPSFPPSVGPAYNGFFGAGLGQTEYHFPESYPTESSARSSPAAPPRSKQFQFAQNITPQDFNNTEKP